MLFLATGLDKIKAAPPAFWWKLALVLGCMIAFVLILRKVAEINKVVLAVILMVVFMVVGVNWIYERNEPAFLTPYVDKIAPFLPSKGAYGAKQQTPADQVMAPPPKKK